ncbi:MAG: polysaccharide deacetylase family protein [Desulfovibrionaceae bacterium]|nr:polysaccharide deacetylase family protein [Desulfovibrionaceae bacterium]
MNGDHCHTSLNRKQRSLEAALGSTALAILCAAFFLLSGVAGHGEQAAATPFAGQSLSEIAAILARRYAHKTPVAWGEHLPGVISTLPLPLAEDSGPVVALTLDACGGRKGASYDAELIALLRQWKIPATLFVASPWIRNNPETLSGLAADPLFEIAAHGSRHCPCSVTGKSIYGIQGTASFAELVAEVEGNARDIERATGQRPRWFRAGTAYYDDLAVQAIRDLGLGIAGYSIAGDEGATLSAAGVKAKILGAKHGDILLLHMNKPHSGTREGLRQSLPLLLEQGTRFVRLSD